MESTEKTNVPWSDEFKEALIKKAAEIEAQQKQDRITEQGNYRFSYTPYSNSSRQVYSNGFGGIGYDPPEPKPEPILPRKISFCQRVLKQHSDFWKKFLNALKLRIKEG